MNEVTATPRAAPRWFLANLVRIHAGHAETGAYSLLEFAGPRGDMPPLHVHERDTEIFYVLDGELSLFVGESVTRVDAGGVVVAPAGIPHVYRVDADEARWLVIASPGADFERFVEQASVPAEAETLPPHHEPTPDEVATLTALAAEHGIELLGPPGTLPS